MQSARQLFTKTTTQPTLAWRKSCSTFSKHAVLHVIFKQLIYTPLSLRIFTESLKCMETYPYTNFTRSGKKENAPDSYPSNSSVLFSLFPSFSRPPRKHFFREHKLF